MFDLAGMTIFANGQVSTFGIAISVVAFWGAIVLIVAIPTIVHHRHKTRVAELNAAIKQQMIERGYSVEEILAVVGENAKLLRDPNKVIKMTPSKVPLHN